MVPRLYSTVKWPEREAGQLDHHLLLISRLCLHGLEFKHKENFTVNVEFVLSYSCVADFDSL